MDWGWVDSLVETVCYYIFNETWGFLMMGIGYRVADLLILRMGGEEEM